jgi:trehalose utilization protein
MVAGISGSVGGAGTVKGNGTTAAGLSGAIGGALNTASAEQNALLREQNALLERIAAMDPAVSVATITRGIDRFIRLEHEETYGEPFVIPTPDKLLLIGSYSGGEVFRSGCLYERGNGKIFYFQPGHESYPTYHVPEVQTILCNAVRFLAPTYRELTPCPHVRKITDNAPYVV